MVKTLNVKEYKRILQIIKNAHLMEKYHIGGGIILNDGSFLEQNKYEVFMQNRNIFLLSREEPILLGKNAKNI